MMMVCVLCNTFTLPSLSPLIGTAAAAARAVRYLKTFFALSLPTLWSFHDADDDTAAAAENGFSLPSLPFLPFTPKLMVQVD